MIARSLPLVLFVATLLSCGSWVGGQIQSGAPLRDFRLPKFGEDGQLDWDFAGESGIYVSDAQVDVRGVKLRVFSDDVPPRQVFEIQSRKASIYPEAGKAQGAGSVYGRSQAFVISGEEWEWNAHTDTLVIEKEVRVIFNQPLNNLLK